MSKRFYLYSNIFAWGLVLFLIGSYVFGWTTPSQTPPGGNITLSSSQWTTSGNDIYYNLGKVGIGITGPSDLLTVNTATNDVGITLRGATTNISPTFKISDSGGTVRTRIGIAGGTNSLVSGAAANDLVIRSEANNILFTNDGGSNVAMTIKSGNVGIGTTDPGTAKLKISGGVLDMTSQKITNLVTPTDPTDAATKGYVDSLAPIGYSECTLVSGTDNASCGVGWNTIANTAGNGCIGGWSSHTIYSGVVGVGNGSVNIYVRVDLNSYVANHGYELADLGNQSAARDCRYLRTSNTNLESQVIVCCH